MTNEVQVDEGVIARKRGACCNQQNIAIEFKIECNQQEHE